MGRAAVDPERRPGDVALVVGEEPGDEGGHLVRPAEPANGERGSHGRRIGGVLAYGFAVEWARG
jgi:hypothetical protein